jgi:hypothetical protein
MQILKIAAVLFYVSEVHARLHGLLINGNAGTQLYSPSDLTETVVAGNLHLDLYLWLGYIIQCLQKSPNFCCWKIPFFPLPSPYPM